MVLEITEGGKRIALGSKQLEPDPWDGVHDRLHEESQVVGRVTRIMDFGAFVELEPGLEGLLHVSQLGIERVRRVRDVIEEGAEVAVRIISIDVSAQRISLSRLDSRGAIIGSDEAVDEATIGEVLRDSSSSLGTNLGDIFRKALKEE